jgi:superfamily II DNA helicase RecQ
MSVRCTFLHSGSHREEDLTSIAKGGDMQVVYACVEMLKTPAVACILHSESFQNQLSAVYIDKAHTVHESHGWRPGYTHIHLVRKIIGPDTPLVCISATQPERYQQSLITHAGLKPDYTLINLGNYRPELSMVVS